ncbi:MAG TPA: hypothetical protein VMW24_25310, partial [Sedimentisphaerales bacterium]|nr:hypothetical protein [Sedimentisphaerales bacterium]
QMVRVMRYLTLVLFAALLSSECQGQEYPYRWVYVSRSLQRDSDLVDIKNIVKTASESGLNGMVLAAGLDRLDGRDPEYFERLKQIRQLCKQRDFEIIPIVLSAGYGGSVLAQDKNLAAGLPVKDALFVVENNQARFVPGTTAKIINPGFEQYEGSSLKGYNFHDRPGEVSFIDTRVFNSGRASLRFENFGNYEHGHARLMQEVKVDPHRCYRVSCMVKTESLQPEGAFRVMVLSTDGRDIAPLDPRVPSTSDWREVTMGFNSLSFDRVRIYLGAWGGESGRFWIDELRVEEVGLLNVLRRPGTPVTVQDEQTHLVYKENKDYAPIADPRLNFRFDHEPVAIEIPPGSKISNGRRLKVSYYHGMAINSGQVTVCMSEPKVYEIWDKQIRLLHEILAPSRYLLSMDEIRAGGACQACKKRKATMAQILGDCITEQVRIVRNVNPQAEVLVWSDMLDPSHNAHADYYLVDGDFAGSWNYVPKDLVIVCWYYEKRAESLAFFSSLGFRTMAGAYYDGDTLDNPSGWLDVLEGTPGASGIMYTTWRNKYDLLAPFGNLVTTRGNLK